MTCSTCGKKYQSYSGYTKHINQYHHSPEPREWWEFYQRPGPDEEEGRARGSGEGDEEDEDDEEEERARGSGDEEEEDEDEDEEEERAGRKRMRDWRGARSEGEEEEERARKRMRDEGGPSSYMAPWSSRTMAPYMSYTVEMVETTVL